MTKTLKRQSAFKIYLSFVQADQKVAEKLRKILSQRDDVKLVAADVRPDENWQTRLSKELARANVFVFVLSPDALESPWFSLELGAVWGRLNAIVAVKTQPEVQIPVQVAGLQGVEWEKALIPGNWDRILSHFEGVLHGNQFNFATSPLA